MLLAGNTVDVQNGGDGWAIIKSWHVNELALPPTGARMHHAQHGSPQGPKNRRRRVRSARLVSCHWALTAGAGQGHGAGGDGGGGDVWNCLATRECSA